MTRWFCYVEGFPSERCLALHWTRKKWRVDPHLTDNIGLTNHPYPIGHTRCGWINVPDKADKKELAA